MPCASITRRCASGPRLFGGCRFAQPQQLDTVTRELLLALQVDGQAEVRSNCAWGLAACISFGADAQEELVHGLLQTLLNDNDFGVRQDAARPWSRMVRCWPSCRPLWKTA